MGSAGKAAGEADESLEARLQGEPVRLVGVLQLQQMARTFSFVELVREFPVIEVDENGDDAGNDVFWGNASLIVRGGAAIEFDKLGTKLLRRRKGRLLPVKRGKVGHHLKRLWRSAAIFFAASVSSPGS